MPADGTALAPDKKVASYCGLHSCSDDGRTMGQHLASRLVELGVDRGEFEVFGGGDGRTIGARRAPSRSTFLYRRAGRTHAHALSHTNVTYTRSSSVFAVPGDYNLVLLDQLIKV